VWTKTYFDGSFVHGRDVLLLGDGYLLLAEGWDHGSQYCSMFLIRTDAAGNKLWQRETSTSGGNTYVSECHSTSDGGFVVVGSFYDNSVYRSALLVSKLNIAGDPQWTYRSSGSINTVGNSIAQLDDGSYIVSGYRNSGANDDENAYLVKLNSTGNMEWFRDIGGAGHEGFNSLRVLPDGGFISVGTTTSFGAEKQDVYLVRTDSTGAVRWQGLYGDEYYNSGSCLVVVSGGAYVITGNTGNSDNNDIFLLKIDASGETIWSRTFATSGHAGGRRVQATADGGYIIVGTGPAQAGGSDFYVIKTDAQGLVH